MPRKKKNLSAKSGLILKQYANVKTNEEPMALTITPNLTNWTLAESSESGSWEVLQVNNGWGQNTDEYVQGSSCWSCTVKTAATRSYMIYNYGSNQNLSNQVIRIWARHGEINKYYSKANGGIRIYVVDGSGNWGEWYVGGNDVTKEGWNYYVVDVNTPFDTGSGTVSFSTLRKIGMSCFMTTKPARSDNVFIDAIRYGRGLIITGTNSIPGKGFAEIADTDESTSNKYGILQKLEGGAYLLTGELIFGDSSGSSSVDFTDTDAPVIFMRTNEKIVGTLDNTGIYNISIVGNATGTTDFELGVLNGTGDDRQGALGPTFVSEDEKFTFDSETDSSDIDSCNLYGVTFENASNIKMAGSTTQEAIGCTFIKCDEIQPNTVEFLNNTIIAPVPDRGLEIVSGHQIKQIDFIAGTTEDQPIRKVYHYSTVTSAYTEYTDEANDSTSDDVIVADSSYLGHIVFGSRSHFSKLGINTSTVRI